MSFTSMAQTYNNDTSPFTVVPEEGLEPVLKVLMKHLPRPSASLAREVHVHLRELCSIAQPP